MRNYEAGRGDDNEPESMTEDRRQLLQELEDLKDGHLNLPGHERLVERAISKIEKDDNTDSAREQLADLDSMVVEAGGEEEEIVKVLKRFVGETSEDDEDEEEDEGWGDDEE